MAGRRERHQKQMDSLQQRHAINTCGQRLRLGSVPARGRATTRAAPGDLTAHTALTAEDAANFLFLSFFFSFLSF